MQSDEDSVFELAVKLSYLTAVRTDLPEPRFLVEDLVSSIIDVQSARASSCGEDAGDDPNYENKEKTTGAIREEQK